MKLVVDGLVDFGGVFHFFEPDHAVPGDRCPVLSRGTFTNQKGSGPVACSQPGIMISASAKRAILVEQVVG